MKNLKVLLAVVFALPAFAHADLICGTVKTTDSQVIIVPPLGDPDQGGMPSPTISTQTVVTFFTDKGKVETTVVGQAKKPSIEMLADFAQREKTAIDRLSTAYITQTQACYDTETFATKITR